MFEIAYAQRELAQKGFCSLCGNKKATHKIGNRQVCGECYGKYGPGNVAPGMGTVMLLEAKAVENFKKMKGGD
jgi:ribosomal protein S27AE